MKRLVAVALLLSLCLPLGGCMKSVGLGQRAIVQAVGVDMEDGEYRLTLAFADTSSKEVESAGLLLAKGGGPTVGEALHSAELQCGRELFWGQNKVIVLGQSTARTGLGGVVSFFGASHQTRPNIDVVTVEGDAAELVSAKVEPGGAADFLQSMLENAEKNGRLPRTRLMEFMGARQVAGSGACTPLVRLTKEADDSQSIEITGLALYRDEFYAGTADLTAARGVLWLRGDVHTTDVAVRGTSDETLTMAVAKAGTKVRPRIVEGTPSFTVECSVDARLAGENLIGTRLTEQTKTAEEAAARVIEGEIEAALRQTLGRSGTDVVGLMLLLRKYEPAWYAQHSTSGENSVMGFTFTLDIQPRVARYGRQS